VKSIQEYLQLLSLPEKFDSLSSIKLQTSNINSEVVLGLDQSNIYHCLFPIKQTLKAKRISRGFSLRSRLLLNESTSKEELFLDLIWSQSNDLKLFCSVVDEIVRQEFNSESIELEIIQVISRWEYLLSPAKTEFTENKCKGLFGELTILSALMRNLSTDFTPVMWTGPLGAPHDFELSDRSIEVKTSQYGVNRIQINGLYQLEKVDEKNLELFHVWVEKDQNGKSIHDLRS